MTNLEIEEQTLKNRMLALDVESRQMDIDDRKKRTVDSRYLDAMQVARKALDEMRQLTELRAVLHLTLETQEKIEEILGQPI